MTRLVRVLTGGTALALAVGAVIVAWTGLPVVTPRPGTSTINAFGDFGPVPDFSLVDRTGRRVGLADLRGKVWLANFIYTQCTETCPLQSGEIARLQQEFAGAKDLRFVSITVDPEHDTPAVLDAYATRYHADPERWLFLTGSKAAIFALAKDGFKLGVTDSDAAQAEPSEWLVGPTPAFASHGSKGLIMHSARFVLVDRKGRIRAYHRSDDPGSLAELRQSLRTLLAES